MSRLSSSARREDFRAILKRAGLSRRRLAAELGMTPQSVDRMLQGLSAPSPRFMRDAALILADRLGEDPNFIRSLLFTDEPGDPEPVNQSVLQRRVAAKGVQTHG